MRSRLLVVCMSIAFLASFYMSPPDLISEVSYGVISGGVCGALVWFSGKVLLGSGKGNRWVFVVSICLAVLVPVLTHLVAYSAFR